MDRRTESDRVAWLDRPLTVGRYGHYGHPVVFFPTGGADWMDCERFQMVRALTPLIEAGRIKLYSIDAVNRDAWTNQDATPAAKAWLQARYDEWLVERAVAFIREDCGGYRDGIAVVGASLGAYQALNALTKHPEHFDVGIGMSGTYVLDRRMAGHRDDNYYFNQPVQFLPHLDGPLLHALRQRFFLFALGAGEAENPDYTWHASRVLGERGVPNHVEIWQRPADHDWPTWRTMLPLFLDRLLPA